MEKILTIITAIIQLAPAVAPLLKQLFAAIFGYTFTTEERAQISAKLDADVAKYNASVQARNAEGG